MTVCKYCKNENPEGVTFCKNCGNTLEKELPKSGPSRLTARRAPSFRKEERKALAYPNEKMGPAGAGGLPLL